MKYDTRLNIVFSRAGSVYRHYHFRGLEGKEMMTPKWEDHIVRTCKTCANLETTAYHKKHGELGWCDYVDFHIEDGDYCSRWKAKV